MNVLEAKDLSFAYGNTPVLDAASFTMCEGGFAALPCFFASLCRSSHPGRGKNKKGTLPVPFCFW